MSQRRRIERKLADKAHSELVRQRIWLRQQIAIAESLLANIGGPLGNGGFSSHVDYLKAQLAELEKSA